MVQRASPFARVSTRARIAAPLGVSALSNSRRSTGVPSALNTCMTQWPRTLIPPWACSSGIVCARVIGVAARISATIRIAGLSLCIRRVVGFMSLSLNGNPVERARYEKLMTTVTSTDWSKFTNGFGSGTSVLVKTPPF